MTTHNGSPLGYTGQEFQPHLLMRKQRLAQIMEPPKAEPGLKPRSSDSKFKAMPTNSQKAETESQSFIFGSCVCTEGITASWGISGVVFWLHKLVVFLAVTLDDG